MKIGHLDSIDAFRAEVRTMKDPELMTHMVGHAFAVDALSYLIREGCTEQNARRMRDSLLEQNAAIAGECQHRLLPVIESRGTT